MFMMADAAGVADFPIHVVGTCSGGPISVFADEVFLAPLTAVSSPDQSGDAVVPVWHQSWGLI